MIRTRTVPGCSARGGAGRRAGFTLLEVLLVLMLISLLGAVMVGGAVSLLRAADDVDPESALLTLLQKTRARAVETGTVIELVPLPEDAGFLVGDDDVVTLPARPGLTARLVKPEFEAGFLIGGMLQERPVERLRFYPDGACDPVRIQVIRGETRRAYAIDPWTAAPLPEATATR